MDNVVPFPVQAAPRPGVELAVLALLQSDDDTSVALACLSDACAIVERKQLQDMADRLLGPIIRGGPQAA